MWLTWNSRIWREWSLERWVRGHIQTSRRTAWSDGSMGDSQIPAPEKQKYDLVTTLWSNISKYLNHKTLLWPRANFYPTQIPVREKQRFYQVPNFYSLLKCLNEKHRVANLYLKVESGKMMQKIIYWFNTYVKQINFSLCGKKKPKKPQVIQHSEGEKL